MLLESWCESHGLVLTLPSACLTPHPSHESTLTCPVSKINSSGNDYSLLDFSMTSPGCLASSWLVWKEDQSDHAMLINTIKTDKKTTSTRTKTKWKPRCINEVTTSFREACFTKEMTREQLCEKALQLQNSMQDNRTCREKSKMRVPPEIRDIFRAMRNATSDEKRRMREESSWRLRVHNGHAAPYSDRKAETRQIAWQVSETFLHPRSICPSRGQWGM